MQHLTLSSVDQNPDAQGIALHLTLAHRSYGNGPDEPGQLPILAINRVYPMPSAPRSRDQFEQRLGGVRHSRMEIEV